MAEDSVRGVKDTFLREAKFGTSQFKGKKDVASHLRRWFIQFVTLSLKNMAIMIRRPLQLAIFLLLPSIIFMPFLVEMNSTSSSSSSAELYPSIPISGLGECDVYYGAECVRIVYGPKSTLANALMKSVSTANGLKYNKDVIGFNSEQQAEEYVAESVGKIQFTVFFRNSSLWETAQYNSPTYVPLSKNMSYVIFFNDSRNNDHRSIQYGLNFPLLVLQKGLEEAYLQYQYGSSFNRYDVNYGNTWSVEKPTRQENLHSNSSTPCDWIHRDNMEALGSILPWVISFVFLFMSNISFQVVAEERRKNLFNSLRRLGLLDSAYWTSWFVTFQLMLITALILSLITAACIRPHSSALAAIDLDVMFLLLWLSGSAFIAMSFCLGALCNSSSVAAAITFTEFLACLITISLCATPLNSYTNVPTASGGASLCYMVTSSYNTIFSTSLLGNTFVQFLVFFLPWFHASQAITDIISTVQYKGQIQSMNDIAHTVVMSYSSTSVDTFDSEWIGWSLQMLTVECVIFMVAAWLAAQLLTADGSEGRPLLSVLIPRFVRDFLFTQEVIYPGDVRGIEKERSRIDNSVRVYKVSKTYSGVQALKEVSFSLAKGEVFVLLGHNGAGKSTLINVITGLIAPTHGNRCRGGAADHWSVRARRLVVG